VLDDDDDDDDDDGDKIRLLTPCKLIQHSVWQTPKFQGVYKILDNETDTPVCLQKYSSDFNEKSDGNMDF